LVAVACFLPGQAKDLSAPPYVHTVTLEIITNCIQQYTVYKLIIFSITNFVCFNLQF
jgi:hypothetical protein